LNWGRYEVQRNINMPMTALRFLRAQNQGRSTFTLEGEKRLDGIDTVLVSFEEHAMPRIIASEDGAPAHGRFWIDPLGRVVRSELSFETSGGRTTTRSVRDRVSLRSLIRVSFGEEPRLKVWLPMSMQEQYYIAAALLEGNATYSNFRRFSVDTATTIKTP
jgi:hypothetical protein